MRLSRRHFTAAVTSILTSSMIGCVTTPDRSLLSQNVSEPEPSFLDRLPFMGGDDEAPEPYPNPVKLAATWTPDTLVQVGRTPTRGFGGRVFFYNEKSQPVPVDGTLTIHGFDENADEAEDGVKRFAFTPEQLTRHYGQSDLGASYSIWIPWDAVGGEQRRISLVTSFQSTSGTTVQGIPATMLLPGKDTNMNSSEKVASLSPQYQDYLSATRSESVPTSGLTTTTIRRKQLGREVQSIQPGISIPSREAMQQGIAGNGLRRSSTLGAPGESGRTKPAFLPASAPKQ